MTFQKWKKFYSNRERNSKLYIEITWHNNLTMLFVGVSTFPFSSDFAQEISFQNKVGRLVYVEKYKLTYCIILDNVTFQGFLNYSF